MLPAWAQRTTNSAPDCLAIRLHQRAQMLRERRGRFSNSSADPMSLQSRATSKIGTDVFTRDVTAF